MVGGIYFAHTDQVCVLAPHTQNTGRPDTPAPPCNVGHLGMGKNSSARRDPHHPRSNIDLGVDGGARAEEVLLRWLASGAAQNVQNFFRQQSLVGLKPGDDWQVRPMPTPYRHAQGHGLRSRRASRALDFSPNGRRVGREGGRAAREIGDGRASRWGDCSPSGTEGKHTLLAC